MCRAEGSGGGCAFVIEIFNPRTDFGFVCYKGVTHAMELNVSCCDGPISCTLINKKQVIDSERVQGHYLPVIPMGVGKGGRHGLRTEAVLRRVLG